ncbi:MAG: putative secreted protein [Candidatus Phytoplasma cynodontis]|nr:MAG: putative secreted protein [Candidatus Phytoplasma cynodontis]
MINKKIKKQNQFEKATKLKKMTSQIILISISIVIIPSLVYALIEYFSQTQFFQRNYKMGIVNQKFLKTNFKSESSSNTKQLIALNIPFIDTDQQTYNIEEIHEVELDQNKLKNQLKSQKAYDILKSNRWLDIHYKVYLVSKNNKPEDNILIINSKDNIDIVTEIFDANSPNQIKETSILPIEISYKKQENTSGKYTDYLNSSGQLNRPEMFIPKKSNEIFSQEEQNRLNNLKDINKKDQEIQKIVDKLNIKKGIALSTNEENRLNNLKDINKKDQEVQKIINELNQKINNNISNEETNQLNNLNDNNKKENEVKKIIDQLNHKKLGQLNHEEFQRLNNLNDINQKEQETNNIILELETKQKNCSDEYISYDIKINFYANESLNQETLESFFNEYNLNNTHRNIKYTDFANDDNDTPTLMFLIDYELVDNNGNSYTNSYKDNFGKTGISKNLPKNTQNQKTNKTKFKIVNTSNSLQKQSA